MTEREQNMHTGANRFGASSYFCVGYHMRCELHHGKIALANGFF